MAEPCEVCGCADRRRLFRKHGFDVVRCDTCGHIYVPFEGTTRDLTRWYDSAFFTNGAYANYPGEQHVFRRNFSRFAERVRRFRPDGRLFEIGAAYGFFLDLARAHWD